MQNTQNAQDRVVTSNSIMQMYKQNPIGMIVGANLSKLYNKYKYAKVNKKKKIDKNVTQYGQNKCVNNCAKHEK